jgi:anti-sigma factor RsiW
LGEINADADSFSEASTREGSPMNNCDEYSIKILRHLENGLEGSELEDFLRHLESCANCRARLEAEKALSQTLQRSRPLYSVPAALRDRVAAMAVQHSEPKRVQDRVDQQRFGSFGRILPSLLERVSSWRILVPAAAVLILCLAFVPDIVRNVQAASYVETAVATHREYVSGKLRSGLQSSSPEAVTAWFQSKVPFDFRLPALESTPEKSPAYRLIGAALVSYKGKPAALVTYETQNDKISLLVDSSSAAIVAGGDEVRFGKLIFHYRNDSGFRVITWTNHGLSYALVSSVSGPARASCLVCHQNMADGGDFKAHT